jgi:hypothetical protein
MRLADSLDSHFTRPVRLRPLLRGSFCLSNHEPTCDRDPEHVPEPEPSSCDLLAGAGVSVSVSGLDSKV